MNKIELLLYAERMSSMIACNWIWTYRHRKTVQIGARTMRIITRDRILNAEEN